ncbi:MULTISPECIES: hypothetical protein [unclassified Shinella]|jgi:hypothetical protein|uniref:hypothetical protein n=1 Tax=unclassified Shinella TaxID=2643062 RepID=UPI00225D039E|nr:MULTISPECIES: hypothetical protein [unclassified Shinella]MCO5140504.1 hypothetical protein [Shinella sp.]CAI0337512.1 hypothetical protein SHINE37_41366 [Rhizobiaceae bacterium]CAK7255998.1 protein of unknown function [Shinella sp. WSC3-e]
MRSTPFTRPTLSAAVELLEQHSQSRFNQVVLRLGLEDEISSDTGISVAKKCDLLGRIVVQRADAVLDTLDGRMTLGEAVVRQATMLAQPDAIHPLQTAFARGGELELTVKLPSRPVLHLRSLGDIEIGQTGSPVARRGKRSVTAGRA